MNQGIKIHGIMMLALYGLFFGAWSAEKTVTVTGTVLDSVTNQPVPQAQVLFFGATSIPGDANAIAKILYTMRLDSTVSGSDGKINYSFKIPSTVLGILCVAFKQDYAWSFKIVVSLLTTKIDAGTLKLWKYAAVPKDTLTVQGTVADAAGNPVAGCSIFMNGLAAQDTAGNTALSDEKGAFSKQVIVGFKETPIIGTLSSRMLVYKAFVDGGKSDSAIGGKSYTGKQVDLGTIRVKKNTSGVATNKRLFRLPPAPSMEVYSLSGRLLYAGPAISPQIIKRMIPENTVIIITKRGGNLLTVRKSAQLH